MAYQKASDKAENYKSSAYSLLLVGVVGIIFIILCAVGVINLSLANHIKIIGGIAMSLMFVIFIIVGIKSLFESKNYAALSQGEDDLSSKIYNYFKENHTKETIDQIALSYDDKFANEETKYFKRDEAIKRLMMQQFGALKLDLLENEAEKIYNLIYED